MIGKLAVVAASGLLALSIGTASAQTQSPSGAANPNSDKCWDAASKEIKTKAEVSGSTTAAGSSGSSATQGSASGSMSSGSAASSDADRPAEAKGLPNC